MCDYKLAPIEPSDEMMEAGSQWYEKNVIQKIVSSTYAAVGCYEAMLSKCKDAGVDRELPSDDQTTKPVTAGKVPHTFIETFYFKNEKNEVFRIFASVTDNKVDVSLSKMKIFYMGYEKPWEAKEFIEMERISSTEVEFI